MQRRGQGASDALGAHTGVLKMRGLPFAASKQDLVEWFRPLPTAPLQPDACVPSPLPPPSRPKQHLAALSQVHRILRMRWPHGPHRCWQHKARAQRAQHLQHDSQQGMHLRL